MLFHDTNMVAARMQFWAFKCSGQKMHSEIMFRLEKRRKHCEIMFVLHAFVLWMMRMIEVEDEKVEDHDMETEEDGDVEEEC